MNIAIYGKGGIGKSTISSNVSVNLSLQGKKVLQIGCDPKHDSTLLLQKSRIEPKTVIEYLQKECSLEEILTTGKHGVSCVEIGGPQPGLGCAGRGIISGLQKLDSFADYDTSVFDCVIYDILGDVVCGGFFEPLKKNMVDEMYVVTSGEFNSLFAAYNLCKGYNNCKLNERGIKFAGIIGNMRGIPQEEEIIKRFCSSLNVPLIAIIPRDNRIEECTIKGMPIADLFPDSDVKKKIDGICQYMGEQKKDVRPTPLSLEEIRGLFENVICNG